MTNLVLVDDIMCVHKIINDNINDRICQNIAGTGKCVKKIILNNYDVKILMIHRKRKC